MSLLRPTARHGVVPTPFAPHKTRDGEGVLRRVGSGSSSSQPGRAARRLTWTDARDVAGRLEHVQIFDTADAMAQCAGIAPESARFAPDHSPVRRDDAVPGVPDAVPSFSPGRFFAFPRLDRSASLDAFVPVVALDDAFRAAARRIATQLLRHEAVHGDTSALDATRRCGKMLKRRVTPGVAAAVEGAAAATRVGSENDSSNVPIDRHVTTAGDALLAWLTVAALGLRRQLDAFEASRRDKKRDIERLLERGDALAASVPSRRVAAALKAVHRDALALIDARARLAAADACVVFLRETVGETVAGSVGKKETRRCVSADADASRRATRRTTRTSATRFSATGATWRAGVLGGARARGLASARDARAVSSLFCFLFSRHDETNDASDVSWCAAPRTSERANERTNRLRRQKKRRENVLSSRRDASRESAVYITRSRRRKSAFFSRGGARPSRRRPDPKPKFSCR